MKIIVLSDNISCGDFNGEWGLSLYIEYNGRRILLDTGASETFISNAGDNCYAGLGFFSKYIGMPKGLVEKYPGRFIRPQGVAQISDGVFLRWIGVNEQLFSFRSRNYRG